MTTGRALVIDVPAWVDAVTTSATLCRSDEEKMALLIRLASENVERGVGRPLRRRGVRGRLRPLDGGGVNSVMRLRNAVLRAESS